MFGIRFSSNLSKVLILLGLLFGLVVFILFTTINPFFVGSAFIITIILAFLFGRILSGPIARSAILRMHKNRVMMKSINIKPDSAVSGESNNETGKNLEDYFIASRKTNPLPPDNMSVTKFYYERFLFLFAFQITAALNIMTYVFRPEVLLTAFMGGAQNSNLLGIMILLNFFAVAPLVYLLSASIWVINDCGLRYYNKERAQIQRVGDYIKGIIGGSGGIGAILFLAKFIYEYYSLGATQITSIITLLVILVSATTMVYLGIFILNEKNTLNKFIISLEKKILI